VGKVPKRKFRVPRFVAYNTGSLPKLYLQNLETVILQPVSYEDERNYDDIRGIHHFRYFYLLPAIRTVSLEGFKDYQGGDHSFPQGLSLTRKAYISHCNMTGPMVEAIIRIPKVLEEFEYSTFGLMNTDGGYS